MSPLKHEKQSSSYFKSIIIFYRAHTPVVGIISFAVIAFGGYFFWHSYDRAVNSEPYLRLSAQNNIELYRSVPYPIKSYYDPDGKYGPAPEQDVTFSTTWNAKNPEVAYIGKKEPTSGTVYPSHEGVAQVSASFAGFLKLVNIKVVNPSLVVTCAPRRIVADEHGDLVAAKGEKVEYVATYIKGGVADYKYAWKAPDEQTSTEILPWFVFSNVGTYKVEATVTDRVGTTVHIQCAPLKVVEG